MSVYVTSDLHANHGNIIDFEERPFRSVQDMQNELTDRWNGVVESDDEVYILGDLWFGASSGKAESLQRFLQGLNGRKHLILGNHDGFKPFTYLSRGIESVHTAFYTEFEKYKIFMCHNKVMAENLKIPEEYNLVLCGHAHSKFIKDERCINVGVDVWDFFPVSFEQLVERFEEE